MNSSRKLPVIAASLALLLFVSALFYPALFQGKILAPLDIATTMLAPWSAQHPGAKPHNHYPADAVTQYLPYRVFAEKSLREDGYIGWNPYEMGGYNLAANTMALPAAWTIQLHRILPFKDAWNLGLIAEFLTAGAGMLVFLRSRKLPWTACLAGAVAFLANSQFIIWIYHRWALGSFCWMPWVLWSVVDVADWKKPTPRLLLLPAFLSLALLGGTLQHAAFIVIACGCLFAAGIRDVRRPFAALPAAMGWALAFTVALAITGFTLIPQVQAYLTNIAIGHTRGGIGYEKGALQPLFQAFLIPAQVWPWLMGDPATIDGFRIFKSGFMDIAYLGTLPMVMAFAGLFRKGMPTAAKWLIAVGLLIPLTPLVGPLYHRVQLVFLLGASWMFAEMLADGVKHPSMILRRWLPVAVATLGIFLVVCTLVPGGTRKSFESKVVAASLNATAKSSLSEDRSWIESRARGWTRRLTLLHPRTAWVFGLLVLGTVGGATLSSRKPDSSRWGTPLILASTSLELLTFFYSWSTFSDPRDFLPTDPSIERTRELAGAQRVFQRADGAGFTQLYATPNLLAAFLVPSVDSYESIQYRSTDHVLAAMSTGDRLSIAGVGVSVQSSGLPPHPGTENWPVADEVSGFTIRKNPSTVPPVLAGKAQLPASPASLLPELRNAETVRESNRTMNRLTLECPPGASWLRISQNWHPGWKWRIAEGPWQSFISGVDSACWIPKPPATGGPLEVRFFPRPSWLSALSIVSAAAWFSGVLLFVRRPKNPVSCTAPVLDA